MSTRQAIHSDEQRVVRLLDELRAMPRTALLIENVPARSEQLAELDVVLDRMRRVVRNDGQRDAYAYLRDLWEQELLRVELARNQPIVTRAALGILEAQWLREHPDHALEQQPYLVLVLMRWASLSLRTAMKAFVVDEGVLTNTPRPAAYQLLVAPRWFASLLPSSFDEPEFGLLGTASTIATQLPLQGLTDLEVHTLIALWTSDVGADFFRRPALLEAVEALRHLDHMTAL